MLSTSMTIFFRHLLLVSLAVFFCFTTANRDCEDPPSDCVWNSQHNCHICDIVGIPKDIVIRRLRLSRYINGTEKVDNIRAPPEIDDTEISWNKEYITLFVSCLCVTIILYQRII